VKDAESIISTPLLWIYVIRILATLQKSFGLKSHPSHIPKMRRTANNPPKLVHAAWEQRATAQMKMFKLAGKH
jgi:hypothetical protein